MAAPQGLKQATGVAGYQLLTLEGQNDAAIGILNLSPGAQVTALIRGTLWWDVAGTASGPLQISSASTFTIDTVHGYDGRVTFSVPSSTGASYPVAAYFTGFSIVAGIGVDKSLPTTAFVVGAGSGAEAGEIIWQSVAQPQNLSAATLKYSAAYSDLQSSMNNSAFQTTSAGQVVFDGTGGFTGKVDMSAPASAPTPLSSNVSVSGTFAVNADGSGTFTPAGAGNSQWPMVTNGVRSYHIIEPGGNVNTAPVVNVITKQ